MKTRSKLSTKFFSNAKNLKTLISENKKNIVLTYLISLLVALVLNLFILYHGPEKKFKEAFVFLYNLGGVSQFLSDTIWKISESNVDAWKTIRQYYTIIFGAISLSFSIPISIFSFYKVNKKTAILNFTWAFSFFMWLCVLKYVKDLNKIILSISWYIDSFLLKNIVDVGKINKNFDLNSISKVSRLFFILIRITFAAIIVGISFGLLYKKGCSFANFDTLMKYYCLKYKKTNFIQKLNILNIVHLIINIIIKSTLLTNKHPESGKVLFDSNKLIFLLFFSIIYIIMINKIVSFIFKKFKLISIYIISSKYKKIQKELHLNNYKYNANISFIKDFEKDDNDKVKINMITSLENYSKIENIVKKTDKDALVFIIPVYKVNQNYKIF